MNLDDTKKKEVIKNIKYIFEPIGGDFSSFGQPYDMYCCIRESGSMESIFSEKNKITIYPIKINTKLGELNISLHSTDLNDLKSAIAIAYSYSGFHQKNKVQNDVSLEIQKRIYS
jgi:hypothetical protein